MTSQPRIWIGAWALTTIGLLANADEGSAWKETRRFASRQAVQAAVAYQQFVYAIDSRSITKHERCSGKAVAESTGKAVHLNSGLVWRGKILCAHSNYPRLPEQSQVMTLDPKTMQLSSWRDFGDYGGSLTWIVRRNGNWLCNFARYEDRNHETFLVEFNDNFAEIRRWRYPTEVISKLGKYSLSGGVWFKDRLLVTGHDEQEIYELLIPGRDEVLQYKRTIKVPFTGQGFAVDDQSNGLVGISRAERQVIFVE